MQPCQSHFASRSEAFAKSADPWHILSFLVPAGNPNHRSVTSATLLPDLEAAVNVCACVYYALEGSVPGWRCCSARFRASIYCRTEEMYSSGTLHKSNGSLPTLLAFAS